MNHYVLFLLKNNKLATAASCLTLPTDFILPVSLLLIGKILFFSESEIFSQSTEGREDRDAVDSATPVEYDVVQQLQEYVKREDATSYVAGKVLVMLSKNRRIINRGHY